LIKEQQNAIGQENILFQRCVVSPIDERSTKQAGFHAGIRAPPGIGTRIPHPKLRENKICILSKAQPQGTRIGLQVNRSELGVGLVNLTGDYFAPIGLAA
jgi:hypothetical protein